MNAREFKEFVNKCNADKAALEQRAASAKDGSELDSIEAEKRALVEKYNQGVEEYRSYVKDIQLKDADIVEPTGADKYKRFEDLRAGKKAEFNMNALMRTTAIATSANVVIPNLYDSNLRDHKFPTISAIYDKLTFTNMVGADSYTVPMQTAYGMGDYTTEGSDYADGTIGFDYVEIKRNKLTVYFELTEEVEKLPAADYAGAVQTELTKALQRKIVYEVINGNGTGKHFSGILSTDANAVKAIPTASDCTAALDKTFIRNVALSYGYNEDTATEETLVMNKKDIAILGKLAGTKNEFALDLNLANHTLDNVPYVVAKDVTDSTTASAGGYIGFYGDISTYNVGIFSNIEVAKSTDYKFKEGMVCYKASVFCGGAPTALCGLMRIKKSA